MAYIARTETTVLNSKGIKTSFCDEYKKVYINYNKSSGAKYAQNISDIANIYITKEALGSLALLDEALINADSKNEILIEGEITDAVNLNANIKKPILLEAEVE